MADFCKQCADDMGFTASDLGNLCTVEDNAAGLYACVLCEGCGPIQVDHLGNCVSPDCLHKHGEASQ